MKIKSIDIKNTYRDKGFIVIKNLIPDEIILKVLDALEIFKKSNKYYYTQSNHTWVKSNKISNEGYLIDSIQTPTKQKNCGALKYAVEDAISCKQISTILNTISGSEEFINWQNMFFDKSTGTLDHADTWYLDTKPRGQMIAAWISPEDIHEDAGRFFVYPESHKLNIPENVTKKIKDHYKYAEFINDYIQKNDLKKYAPKLKKGDVLFWHPFTIHGSWNQKSELYSRKSITAHYHPVGAMRMYSAETNKLVKRYIKKMRKSPNPAISFDNNDPSNFQFTTLSFSKWILKKLLLNGQDLRRSVMNREILKKDNIL